jgi:Arm DNA-binding domain
MAINLTAKTIEKLRKQPGRYLDEQVKGLMLVVAGPNSVNWTLRYEFGGREKWLGLGGLRDVPLAAARERARAKRLLLVDGIDPLDQKRAEKAARRAADLRSMTSQQCAEAYINAHAGKWRSAQHGTQWTSSLRDYAFPVIGDLPVAAIDTPLNRALAPKKRSKSPTTTPGSTRDRWRPTSKAADSSTKKDQKDKTLWSHLISCR